MKEVEFHREKLDNGVTVLFEKPGLLPAQMVGTSEYLHAVHVTSDQVARGDLAKVRIVESVRNSLAGEVI